MDEVGIDRLARLEVKTEVLGDKVDKVGDRVESMDCKISDIYSAVVVNKVNTSWNKKLMILIISLLLGGGSIAGWKTFSEPAEAKSKPAPHSITNGPE